MEMEGKQTRPYFIVTFAGDALTTRPKGNEPVSGWIIHL